MFNGDNFGVVNPSVSALMKLTDFALSNARRFTRQWGTPRTLRG